MVEVGTQKLIEAQMAVTRLRALQQKNPDYTLPLERAVEDGSALRPFNFCVADDGRVFYVRDWSANVRINEAVEFTAVMIGGKVPEQQPNANS